MSEVIWFFFFRGIFIRIFLYYFVIECVNYDVKMFGFLFFVKIMEVLILVDGGYFFLFVLVSSLK